MFTDFVGAARKDAAKEWTPQRVAEISKVLAAKQTNRTCRKIFTRQLLQPITAFDNS